MIIIRRIDDYMYVLFTNNTSEGSSKLLISRVLVKRIQCEFSASAKRVTYFYAEVK